MRKTKRYGFSNGYNIFMPEPQADLIGLKVSKSVMREAELTAEKRKTTAFAVLESWLEEGAKK